MVFLLVLLAMPAASYFFVFEPRNKQIAEARREVAQKQAKLEQLEAATRNIADLGVEIDKLSEAIEVFEQKLPAEREVEVILKQISELATKHKLTLKSIRTDKPVPAAGYSELPIKLTIAGDFDGYYSFLLDLEKLKRITRMPQMQVKKVPPEEGQMQAEVVLSIFFEAQSHTGSDTGKGRL